MVICDGLCAIPSCVFRSPCALLREKKNKRKNKNHIKSHNAWKKVYQVNEHSPLNLIPDDTIVNVARRRHRVSRPMRIHSEGYLMRRALPFPYTSRHAYVHVDAVHSCDHVVLQIDKANLRINTNNVRRRTFMWVSLETYPLRLRSRRGMVWHRAASWDHPSVPSEDSRPSSSSTLTTVFDCASGCPPSSSLMVDLPANRRWRREVKQSTN